MTTTSDVLNKAADLIEERGWAFGTGWLGTEEPGGLCVEGAIQAATGVAVGPGYRCPAYFAVATHLEQFVLFTWNDNLPWDATNGFRWVGGTKESATEFGKSRVIEVLRACAVIEASREREAAEVAS